MSSLTKGHMPVGFESPLIIIAIAFILAIIIIYVSPSLLGWDHCGYSDRFEACQKYGKCVSGSTCAQACQKMANAENKTVYCECPCATCDKPTCFRKHYYPEVVNNGR